MMGGCKGAMSEARYVISGFFPANNHFFSRSLNEKSGMDIGEMAGFEICEAV